MAQIRRVRTVFTGVAGAPYYSNLYFQYVAGDANQAILAVDQFWEAMDAVITEDLSWDVQGSTDILDDSTGQIVASETGVVLGGVGAQTGEKLPPANQYLLNTYTGVFVGGRQLRGKVFVPGLSDLDLNEGQPSNNALIVIQQAGDGLVSATAAGGQWVVYSPTYGMSAPVTATAPYPGYAVLRSRRD